MVHMCRVARSMLNVYIIKPMLNLNLVLLTPALSDSDFAKSLYSTKFEALKMM